MESTNKFKLLPLVLLCSTLCFTTQVAAKEITNDPLPATDPYWKTEQPWRLTVGLDYMKASNNDTNYANTINRDFNINTDYHLGYQIGLGYRIPDTGTVVGINYTYLRTDDSSSVNLNNNLWINGFNVNRAHGSIEYTFNKFDVTAGHEIPLNRSFTTNFYGGLNYTRLQRDMVITGSNFSDDFSIYGGTDFKGIGPVFGIDAICNPFANMREFAFEGGVRTAFPYGHLSTYARSYINDDLEDRDRIPSEEKVVLEADAYIGIRYLFNASGMNWGLSLGYESNNYLGSMRSDYSSGSTSNTSTTGAYLQMLGIF